MWNRLWMTAACVVGAAGPAAAQFPYGGYGGYYPQNPYGNSPGGNPAYMNPANVMPNIFNPQTQPLSPYLNLLRGSNPAANYYFGVRPGTVGGAGTIGGGTMPTMGGMRAPYFPELVAAPDPLQSPELGKGDVLPPAGHPVTFNNTLGYFPGGMGGRGGMSGMGGMGGFGMRPGGAMGMGASSGQGRPQTGRPR